MKKIIWSVCALIMTGSSNDADARPCHVMYGCRACGASYTCFCDHWICLNPYPGPECNGKLRVGGIRLGDASPEDIAAGDGNVDVTIVQDTSQVHLLFHRDLEMPPDSSLLPVATNFALGPEVSNALGYSSVILVQGDYPVDFSNNPYGETTIDAVLIGPIVPTVSEWGMVVISLLLLTGIAIKFGRRRAAA